MKTALRLLSGLLVLLLLVAAVLWLSVAIDPAPHPAPIYSKPYSGNDFERFPVTPQPLTGFAATPINHPFMAFEGGGLHGNAYNSDVHITPGPAGHNLEVLTRSVSPTPGGLCPTITFDKEGRIVAMCAAFLGFELNLFEPHTLKLLARYRLPTRPSTFEAAVKLNIDIIFLDTSGGSYFYLDNEDRAVLANARQEIVRIGHRQNESGAWEFYESDNWNLADVAPHDCMDINNWFSTGECDPITSVMPDYQGLIWWVSRRGRVGTVNPATGIKAVHHFEGEEIENSLSADETGMYVITDHALYFMTANSAGKPQAVWREEYPRSNVYRYGNINNGSGSTPTLMDTEEGKRYVAITDAGSDATGLVVYRRDRAVTGPRQVCRIPLFTRDATAVEISPIGWGRSIVVKNDAGYRSAFHGTSEKTIAGGIWRIDVREDESGCDVIWKAADRVPAVVAKLSTNGLIYVYSFIEAPDGENAWFFQTLDFASGKTVYRKFIGAGQNYDINWGSPAIARDGTVYLGILEGIIRVRDGKTTGGAP